MAKKQALTADAKADKQPNPVERFKRYVEDSKTELRKVSWPTPKETRKAVLAVLGFVTVMAIILGLVDFGLSALIKFVLS